MIRRVVAVAKRRRVGNMLALAVLSVLVPAPMHPYEMASVLRERGKDHDMRIKWGSLYTVVRNMSKHGLIEAVESEREGGRPERTIYRITDAGRAEMVDWVRELLGSPESEQRRFQAGLSLLAVLPPGEVVALLRQRLELLEPETAARRKALTRYRPELPRLFLVEVEYELAMRDAEVRWIRALVQELHNGSFPDIAAWAAWHETGELPQDLAELAERGRNKR